MRWLRSRFRRGKTVRGLCLATCHTIWTRIHRPRFREVNEPKARLTIVHARPPAAIVTAIAAKEREIDSIHEKLLGPGPESFEARIQSVRQFAMSRLTDVRRLLQEDVPTAKLSSGGTWNRSN